jgi:hypothetical protein
MNDARVTFDFGNGFRGRVGMGAAGFRLLCPYDDFDKVILLEVASYFGRANPNIWSWIKGKMEATS